MTMTISQQKQTLREELDYRESDGIEVSLLWSRADGSVAIAVRDARSRAVRAPCRTKAGARRFPGIRSPTPRVVDFSPTRGRVRTRSIRT